MAFIFSFILSLFSMGIIYYISLPVFAWRFFSTFFFLLIAFLPFIFVFSNDNKKFMFGAVEVVFFIGLIAISFLTTAPMFHSTNYRNLIGQVQTQEYKTSLPPIDIKNAPLVSQHMADQVAQKKLSDIPALGSQFHIGTLTKQNVNGKLYWVAFLEYQGFFQWFQGSGSPGYIKVSATNPSDIELVTKLDGKDLHLSYLESAYFGTDAMRQIYFSGNQSVGITDLSPELDDQGHPYIVATRYLPQVGFSGDDAVGVAILDVQTGQVTNYDLDHIPSWVDRVYPAEFISTQVQDWGIYINGWFNPSNKGQLTISDKIDLVYGEEGQCYFYVGISSVGKDNGIVGFMLINSKNKKTEFFQVSGAAEYVAASSAENVIPEKHYSATNPLPFMVNGQPTYLMALTDSNGIPRAYGMVNIEDYQVLAVGETLGDAYQKYQNNLAKKHGVSITENESLSSLKSVVERIASEIRSGNTLFYLKVKGSDSIFTLNSDLNEEIVITKAGDQVEITYPKCESKIINLVKFDNLNLPTK